MFSSLRQALTLPFVVAALVPLSCFQRASAQGEVRPTPLGAIVPNHYLVAYRGGVLPAEIGAPTALAGAKLLQRNDRLGFAIVQANGVFNDAVNMRQLAAQPNVDFVIHDRRVYAHQVVVSTDRLHNPLVRPVGPSEIQVAPLPSSDDYYKTPQGWAVRQVGGYGKKIEGGPAYGPWDISMGKGVRVAILDSGVDAAHPDIAPNLVLNLSEIDQTAQTGLPSSCDDGSPQDQQGHGTWVASLAVGAMGKDTGLVIGVAPEASLLNIKVLERMPDLSSKSADPSQQCSSGQASGLMSWVLQGIADALANHADIISMSLGSMVDLSTGDGAGLKTLFDRATYAAAQKGVILIAAAGNDGFDFSNPRYIELPAQARGVLTVVASTNPACAENLSSGAICIPGPVTLPYYSNFGGPLDAVSAPGGSLPAGGDDGVSGWVRGACSSGKPLTADGPPVDSAHSFGCFNLGHTQYVQAMGTSAAAPLVAGVAALLRSVYPQWDAATMIATLRSFSHASSALPYAGVSAFMGLGLSK